ncbi:MAG: hypothetical protein LBK25_06605 [Treponema sp.]|jgi:hypothetical protein|nr:hypothetical protein [Treponema sp.]
MKTNRVNPILPALLAVSALLSSCAISKALYLGADTYSVKAAPQSAETPSDAENVNGVFPDAVYIKTRTQTFNAYHYYILRDGLIWYKSIDEGQEPLEWTLFTKTGLPHNSRKAGFNKPKSIVEISADADELVALSDEGGFYRYCFDKTIAHKSNVWFDRQGWPTEEQLFLDQRAAGNLSWSLGKRNAHVLYYEDPFGNQHHNGTMEIATTYVLLEDGQEICYADTGLPGDFSRNYIGPERGAFKAVSLSASASTMFVINSAGEMYTRLADFDTIGCDPLWFKYTYVPYESDLSGADYFSNLNEWALPAEEWRSQPRVPLLGKAALTRHVTILQNGQGNNARELRVAGLNESGETGYWTKAIFDDTWSFKQVPLYFGEDSVLAIAESTENNPRGERGLPLDKQYRGYFWNGGEKETEWEYTISNFNILEGDCDLRITWQGETCTLKLYPVEMWTYLKRDYLPGRTGSPKMFLVTLEIPDDAFDGLSTAFVAHLTQKYAKHDKQLFHYTIAAANHYMFLRDTDDTESVFFLTDGTVSDTYSEFRQPMFVEDFEEMRRYHSTELSIDRHTAPAYENVLGKIALNKAFRDELKYQVRSLKWSQLTAFKFDFGYIPAHYLAILTPLRFVDMPKIRTVTSFGDRIILTNSAYIYTVSNTRIWVYEKLIELLELRLRHYNDLAKELSDGAAETASSPWYSEDISDYWGSAGLPRVIAGTFFGPDLVQGQTQIPAVLSFVPPTKDTELFGWYLSIGEATALDGADSRFSIFIDPLKSAGAIYSRNGKSPKEKRLQVDCALYINPGTNPPIAQDVVDHVLKPFVAEGKQSITARISFDGRTFEIREHPARHAHSLIFQGNL